MTRIGASTLSLFHNSLLDTIDKLGKMNFNLIEVLCESPQAHPDELLAQKNILKDIKELTNEFNIDLLLHAPISDVNPMSPNPGVRKEAQRQLIQTIYLAKELSCKRIVFHIGGRPSMGMYDVSKARVDCLEVISEVLKVAEPLNTRVLLENDPVKKGLGAITPSECMNIVSAFKGRLGFLLDIGHGNMLGKTGNIDFISYMGKLIEGIHISDNLGQMDEHLGLGTGNIHIKSIAKKLQEVSFDGEMIIEVMKEEDLLNTKNILSKTIGEIK